MTTRNELEVLAILYTQKPDSREKGGKEIHAALQVNHTALAGHLVTKHVLLLYNRVGRESCEAILK